MFKLSIPGLFYLWGKMKKQNHNNRISELVELVNKVYPKNYVESKYKTDLKFNLNQKMNSAIGNSLKGNKKGHKWESIVNYTLDDLFKHLKKTMPKGYTWQDFLEGKLHIEHITPISAFNFTKPEHINFKRCWALKNLRLLPAKENMIKGSKLSKPFQPALSI